jgi:8-oxo-dGTP pyrophosphatase MutT (NUDIX family)
LKIFDTQAQLRIWLQQQNIDLTQWGHGPAKSLAYLWRELQNGDTLIQEQPPLRVVNVVQVIIRRGDLVLLEKAQEFGNGQRRFRNQPPSEKMRAGEDYLAAARRGLLEELGLQPEQITLFPDTYRQRHTITESPSYPGLPTRYTFHQIEAAVSNLPTTDFWHDNDSYEKGDPVKRHHWAWLDPQLATTLKL